MTTIWHNWYSLLVPILVLAVLAWHFVPAAYEVPVAVKDADRLATAVVIVRYDPLVFEFVSVDSAQMDVLAYNNLNGELRLALLNVYGISGDVTLCAVQMMRTSPKPAIITIEYQQTYRIDYTEQRFDQQTVTVPRVPIRLESRYPNVPLNRPMFVSPREGMRQ